MIHETLNIVDEIRLRASDLLLRSDGIMHVKIKDVDELKEQDMIDIVDGLYRIGKGKKFLNLITNEKFLIVDKEVRRFASSEEGGKYSLADAIVVNSVALKLLVNIYIAFNKPLRPTRMFDSEKKAVEWLKSLK